MSVDLPIRGTAVSRACCEVERSRSHATAGMTTDKPNISRYIAKMSRQQVNSIAMLYLPKSVNISTFSILRKSDCKKNLNFFTLYATLYCVKPSSGTANYH